MRPALLLMPLALVACGEAAEQPQDLNSLDRELTAAARGAGPDPAIAAALHDPIMIDPTLAQQSNANALRPPPRADPLSVPADPPLTDPVPLAGLRRAPAPRGGCPECKAPALTLGAIAARSRPACAGVTYSFTWANRLPADLPLYPGAQVTEAAGNDRSRCGLRVVSFATAAPAAKLVDWYYTRAAAAGWSAEQRAEGSTRLLGGTRGAAAYLIQVSPRDGGGSDVDLLVNAGR